MKTLADDLYAACRDPKRLIGNTDLSETRRTAVALRAQLLSARKFFVDAEATVAAVELGTQHPDLLLQALHRAWAPFRTTWIEWDNEAACEASGLPRVERPSRVGAMIERLDEDEPLYRLTSYASSTDPSRREFALPDTSIVYHLTKPVADFVGDGDLGRMASITGFAREHIEATALGSVYVRGDDVDPEVVEHRLARCREFKRHARYTFSPQLGPMMRRVAAREGVHGTPAAVAASKEVLRNNLLENSGTFRVVVALLALINARDYVDADTVARSGRTRAVNGKIVPYLDHWLVKLKLPRKLVLARSVKNMADALPRRLHEVVGHWKHSRTRGDADCDHAYVDETPRRQVCALCGGKRWFVNEFMRGDARIGIVTKDRLVTLEW